MRLDPAAPLAEAAARRHERTRSKAIQALRELDRDGRPVTFAAVASTAWISRSWLYTQPDIRDQVQRLRTARMSERVRIPAGQRATDESLGARLTGAPGATSHPPTRTPAPPPARPRARHRTPSLMST